MIVRQTILTEITSDNTSLLTKYNERVTSVFGSTPVTEFNRSHIGNFDAAWSEPLSNTPGNATIHYSETGGVGISFDTNRYNRKNYSINHSGYGLGYTWLPDYHIHFSRNDNINTLSCKITSKRNSTYLVCLYENSIDTLLFTFDFVNLQFVDILYKNIATAHVNATYAFAVSHYNEPWPSYCNLSSASSPTIVQALGNTFIKKISSTTYDYYINNTTGNLDTTIVPLQPAILNYTDVNPYVSNIITPNIDITGVEYDVRNYTQSLFVEGIDKDISINIHMLNTGHNFSEYLKNNDPYTIDNTTKTGIMVTAGNYYRMIYPTDEPMIPGYISGTISLTACRVPPGNQFILCFREADNFLIGKYPVTNNTYMIPNLDINTFYNIMLIDESRSYEWMVSSHKTPIAYEIYNGDPIIPAIIQGFNIYNSSDFKSLIWYMSNTNVDYFNIYISQLPFTYETRNRHDVHRASTIGLSYALPIEETRRYLILESIYNKVATDHKVLTINNNTAIQLEGQYSE